MTPAPSGADSPPLPPGFLASLRSVFPPGDLRTDPETLEGYASDETEGLHVLPAAVVFARRTSQVSQLLSLATRHGVPVTPRTGGTCVTGGAVPLPGGVVLTLEKMDRILEIDGENMSAVVEPGVVTGEFQRAVEEEGLFFPPDPASLDSCTIGGNVAECAGGPRAAKYGVTKNFVTGLEFVLPTGEVTRWGGKLRKDVAGYDVGSLVIGSEGTLAVVTEITLRLLPRPAVSTDLWVPFGSIEEASRAAVAVMLARLGPAAMEFMDPVCLAATRDFTGRTLPHRGEAGAVLLVQMDGPNPVEVERAFEEAGGIFLEGGALEVYVAGSSSEKERMWEFRRKLREALLARCPGKFSEDVVVPPVRIPGLLELLKETGERWGVEMACFGHIGDGNVHVNVLPGGLDAAGWDRAKEPVMRAVFDAAVSLGGTLSGEHGIGTTKRDFMSLRFTPEQMALMRRIKKAFDPAGILNPGKIFTLE
jgi:glycolate oxidase